MILNYIESAYHQLKAVWNCHANDYKVRQYTSYMVVACTNLPVTKPQQERIVQHVYNVSYMCQLYGIVLAPLQVSVLESIVILEWVYKGSTFQIHIDEFDDTWRFRQGGTKDGLLARSGPMLGSKPYKILLEMHR